MSQGQRVERETTAIQTSDSHSKMSGSEFSSLEQPMFSTPLVPASEDCGFHDEKHRTVLINDSGFSDRTFNSTVSTGRDDQSVSHLSDLSEVDFSHQGTGPSPVVRFISKTRRTVSLPDCDISPVQRDDLFPKGRRLTFNTAQPLLLPFHLPSGDEEETADDFHDKKEENQPDGILHERIGAGADKADSPTSLASSSHSSITDSLEFSMQEMSLEESASESTNHSPVYFQPVSSSNPFTTSQSQVHALVRHNRREFLSGTSSFPALNSRESSVSEDESGNIASDELESSDFDSPRETSPAQCTLGSNAAHCFSLPVSTIHSSTHPFPPHNSTLIRPAQNTPCTFANIPSVSSVSGLTCPGQTEDTAWRRLEEKPVISCDNPLLKSPSKRCSTKLDRDLYITSPSKFRRVSSLSRPPLLSERAQCKTALAFQSPVKKDTSNICQREPIPTAEKQCVHVDASSHSQNQTICRKHQPVLRNLSFEPKSSIRNVAFLNSRGEKILQQVVDRCSPPEPSQLIGRSTGLRYTDIVGELTHRNFLHITHKIFQHLSSLDLFSVRQVSGVWLQAVLDHEKCWQPQHLTEQITGQTEKENEMKKQVDDKPVGARPMTESKGLLTVIQPQAGRTTLPMDADQEEKQPALLSEDQLRPCPKCQGQSLVAAHQDRAVCLSPQCGFDFCTLCFSSFHQARPCKPLCRLMSRTDLAGTRKSRKNLRRL